MKSLVVWVVLLGLAVAISATEPSSAASPTAAAQQPASPASDALSPTSGPTGSSSQSQDQAAASTSASASASAQTAQTQLSAAAPVQISYPIYVPLQRATASPAQYRVMLDHAQRALYHLDLLLTHEQDARDQWKATKAEQEYVRDVAQARSAVLQKRRDFLRRQLKELKAQMDTPTSSYASHRRVATTRALMERAVDELGATYSFLVDTLRYLSKRNADKHIGDTPETLPEYGLEVPPPVVSTESDQSQYMAQMQDIRKGLLANLALLSSDNKRVTQHRAHIDRLSSALIKYLQELRGALKRYHRAAGPGVTIPAVIEAERTVRKASAAKPTGDAYDIDVVELPEQVAALQVPIIAGQGELRDNITHTLGPDDIVHETMNLKPDNSSSASANGTSADASAAAATQQSQQQKSQQQLAAIAAADAAAQAQAQAEAQKQQAAATAAAAAAEAEARRLQQQQQATATAAAAAQAATQAQGTDGSGGNYTAPPVERDKEGGVVCLLLHDSGRNLVQREIARQMKYHHKAYTLMGQNPATAKSVLAPIRSPVSRKLWGDLPVRLLSAGCDRVKVLISDTLTRTWDDTELQLEYCHALDYRRVSIVFAHGTANLALAAAAAHGYAGCEIFAVRPGAVVPSALTTSLPPTTHTTKPIPRYWYAVQPAFHGSLLVDTLIRKQWCKTAAKLPSLKSVPVLRRFCDFDLARPQRTWVGVSTHYVSGRGHRHADITNPRHLRVEYDCARNETLRWDGTMKARDGLSTNCVTLGQIAEAYVQGQLCGTTPGPLKDTLGVLGSPLKPLLDLVAERWSDADRAAVQFTAQQLQGNDGLVGWSSCKIESSSGWGRTPESTFYAAHINHQAGSCAHGDATAPAAASDAGGVIKNLLQVAPKVPLAARQPCRWYEERVKEAVTLITTAQQQQQQK